MVVICHANVRSLVADGRLLNVSSLVSFNNVDIFCLSETWLKPKHLSSSLLIPGFQPPLRCDRLANRGGGVAVYFRDGLAFKELRIVPAGIECLAVDVILPRRKRLTVVTCYRPPRQNMQEFLDLLESVLSSVRSGEICVTGDFNAKHFEWCPCQFTDPDGIALKHLTDGLALHQVITRPTYNVDAANPALLDLIFVSKPSSVVSTTVLPPVSDHCPVIAHLSIRKAPPLKSFTKISWSYDTANEDLLKQSMSSCDWASLPVMNSLDAAVSAWQRMFLDACSVAIPKRRCSVYPSSKPWFSSYLRYLARCRDRLFHRSRGYGTVSRVVVAYRKVRNLFVSELRAAQKRYYRDLGCQLTSPGMTPRRWWSLAKRACGWSSPRCLPALSVGSTVVTEPLAKACTLNSHFQQQCSTSSGAHPALLTQLESSPVTGPCFSFDEISPAGVATIIRNLANWKSCGSDGITNMLLKMSVDEVCSPLSALFNRSLGVGIFPDNWKEGIVSPVYKEGKDPSLPGSYRPITLLSCPSKVLEHCVRDQLTAFCLHNDVLPDEQFGFLKGRSSEWQLLSVLEDWHTALDRHCCVHAAFIDAAKAFDRVDHSILLKRLAEIGVRGSALRWFHSYLSGRRIATKVQGAVSASLGVTSGVPQGSGLGPLLFLIYFRDIPSVVSAATALFADDTLIYRCDCEGRRRTPCCNLGQDLRDLTMWADCSSVEFNCTKSAELCLGAAPPVLSVQLTGSPLPRVDSIIHLGVLLERNLRWSAHIERLLRALAGPVALCKRLAFTHHLPPVVLRRFYLAYIRPRMEYCSAVWGGASHALLFKLEHVQLKMARLLVAPAQRHLSGRDLLEAANLATLEWRRREHRLTILWKLVKNLGPPQLSRSLPLSASSRSDCSLRAPHRLQFPASRSSRHLSSFLCVAIPEWNSLPYATVSCSRASSFVSGLRQLFSSDKFHVGLC